MKRAFMPIKKPSNKQAKESAPETRSVTAAPFLQERVEASAEPVLKAMLGSPLPVTEATYWASLTPSKREAATRRLLALRDWSAAAGSISVKDAAISAGISANRFYRLAADWRRRPSLASLGVLATADRSAAAKVAGPVNAALLKAVPQIVRELRHGSVRAQVALLRERMGPSLGKELPGESRLRQYVEQERRRDQARAEVGNYLAFDCAACSLTRADGRPWVIFALLDRRSGLILGFQLGTTTNSASAFGPVAQDALHRMSTVWARSLPWAPVCARIDVVVGGDAESGADSADWKAAKDAIDRLNTGINIVPVTNPRRHGRYFRELVGPTIGRLMLSSAATADKRVRTTDSPVGIAAAEALMAIEVEVGRYNDAALTGLGRGALQGAITPPANLLDLMEQLKGEPFLRVPPTT